jgi:DnaJ-class molecular chaperone
MNMVILILGGAMLVVGSFFVYSDYKEDPYGILKLITYQFILWGRIKGPIITRKPYAYYFPTLGSNSQDISRSIVATPSELEKGVTKILKIKSPELCPECQGKRGKSFSVQVECSHCQNGVQYHHVGTISMPLPCKHCLGTAWKPIENCPTCNGDGCRWKYKKIKVHIPPHSSFGMQLRIPKQGKIELKMFQIGDLYLKLRRKVFGIF